MEHGEKMNVDTYPPPPATALASQEFLDTILKALSRICDCYTIDFDRLSMRDTALSLLQRIDTEIATLRRNPQQFIDAPAFELFFADVDRCAHQIMETIRLQRAREDMDEELTMLRARENYRRHRPTYTTELMRAPWQQFLHPEAPGWPGQMSTPPGVVESHQKIPSGGMRILMKWEEEVKQIYDFLDTQRGIPSRFQSSLERLAKEPAIGRLKNGNVRSVELRRMQPPFTRLYRDLREYEHGDFTLANRTLGGFEGHRADSAWLVADVKVWKKANVQAGQNIE